MDTFCYVQLRLFTRCSCTAAYRSKAHNCVAVAFLVQSSAAVLSNGAVPAKFSCGAHIYQQVRTPTEQICISGDCFSFSRRTMAQVLHRRPRLRSRACKLFAGQEMHALRNDQHRPRFWTCMSISAVVFDQAPSRRAATIWYPPSVAAIPALPR